MPKRGQKSAEAPEEKVSTTPSNDMEWTVGQKTVKPGTICRTKDCGKDAVAIWESKSDVWPTCLECQELHFGGGEIPVEPTQEEDDTHHDVEFVTDSTETATDAASSQGVEDHEDHEEEDEEEKWNIVQYLDPKDPTICRTEDCQGQAVAVWCSNLDPSDQWPACLACQLRDYALDRDEFEAMAAAAQKDPATEGDDTKEEEDDEEEKWEIKKVISLEALKGSPVICSTEGCMLPAACVYASNLEPSTMWYSCLDCQVRIQIVLIY